MVNLESIHHCTSHPRKVEPRCLIPTDHRAPRGMHLCPPCQTTPLDVARHHTRARLLPNLESRVAISSLSLRMAPSPLQGIEHMQAAAVRRRFQRPKARHLTENPLHHQGLLLDLENTDPKTAGTTIRPGTRKRRVAIPEVQVRFFMSCRPSSITIHATRTIT